MIPSAAVNHSEAAVMSPATLKNPCLKITPAPRKPMPVMMPWITRLGFGAEILIDRDAEPGRLIDRHVSSKPGRPSSKPIRAPARSAAQSRTYAVLWGRELLIGDEEACPSKPSSAPLRCSRPGLFIGRVPEEERA